MFSLNRYIDNIDECNALLFFEISSGKQLTTSLCRFGRAYPKQADRAWRRLFNQYLDTFGIPTEYKRYLKSYLKVIEINYDIQINKKVSKHAILEHELNKLEGVTNEEAQDIHLLSAYLSKVMGFQVNPKATSVRQFISYVKLSSKHG